MKRQVPGGEPRILPFVGHRQNAHRVQMLPTRIPAAPPGLWRSVVRIVTFEPKIDVVKVDLFAPEHAG